MTFIVILIGLLVERFFDWSHLRNWHWFSRVQDKIVKQFPTFFPYLIISLTLLPLLILILVIHYFLLGIIYGFGSLIFDVVILLYCFGPQNLWADVFSSLNQLSQNDTQLTHDRLIMTFGIKESGDIASLRKSLLNQIFIESYRRVFAIIFWYLLLGVFGVVLYRGIDISTDGHEEKRAGLNKASLQIKAVLDWVPVRIYTFLFALGGHFIQVLSIWKQYIFKGLSYNELLLTECGLAAVDEDKTSLLKSDAAEKHAISLIDRVFIISLVIIVLGSFIFW